ncbi:MBOAT family O-acyltransferase [Acidisphaera rubrifaciens]|uniref:Probable alginate O-acetylase AlgI n=1 Tax=Acidisphaera rubrifaciens HS-AP3 TaxID=1231350 RepID=A0A0D6PA11_9PROT|nr:MBOAT family protein [Acidisphaera rubrifaciens]GAN78043.1 alginate O-acetyltransferase [Acidisphaera rubrifaciens HS-AP3]
MLFPTLDFLLFFVAVVALLALLRDSYRAQKLLLVGASYFFYAQWDWRFCFLLAFSSVVTYLAGLALARVGPAGVGPAQARRAIVAVTVTIHLATLGFFKYFDFFVHSADELLHRLRLHGELPVLEVILPVGISFFTFHGISYVVDVYRGDVAVCRRPSDMLLYLSFFPQLVAGPIVRAAKFLPQLYERPQLDFGLAWPLVLILGGLFKKVVMANDIAVGLVDPVFDDPIHHGLPDLLLGLYGYAVQIYCDFSAYTDIAIGLAALLGYAFPVNFNQPYRAASLQDFWRRWHMSLSSWLRDYLYKPLGGSRHGEWKTARNLAITMLLGGIWHGAAWKFVFWGALHGVGLGVERFVLRHHDRLRGPPPTRPGLWPHVRKVLAIVLVFHFVCLGWLFFRADSFDTATLYLQQMASGDWSLTQATPFVVGLIVLGMVLQFLPPDLPRRIAARLAWAPDWMLGAEAGLVVAAINAIGPDGVAPFIYFQF